MRPGTFPLNLYRGDTGRWLFRLWSDAEKTLPVDLAGNTAVAQIRDEVNGTLLVSMSCVISLPNIINMTLLATDSSTLPTDVPCQDVAPYTIGVWDLQLTYTGGDILTLLTGPVKVAGDVTRLVAEPSL